VVASVQAHGMDVVLTTKRADASALLFQEKELKKGTLHDLII